MNPDFIGPDSGQKGDKRMERTGLQRTWVRMLLTFLTLAVMMMIFVFSTENAERSDATSGQFSRIVISVIYPEYDGYSAERQKALFEEVQFSVRKAAHFTEYMVLGLLIRLCLESWFGKRKSLPVSSWAAGALYACTDELHQLLTDGRSGQWQDVLIDSSGVLTGVLISTLALKLVRRNARTKKGTDPCP